MRFYRTDLVSGPNMTDKDRRRISWSTVCRSKLVGDQLFNAIRKFKYNSRVHNFEEQSKGKHGSSHAEKRVVLN